MSRAVAVKNSKNAAVQIDKRYEMCKARFKSRTFKYFVGQEVMIDSRGLKWYNGGA